MAEGRRYLGLEVLARCRADLVPDIDTEIGADQLPALTAWTQEKGNAALHLYRELDQLWKRTQKNNIRKALNRHPGPRSRLIPAGSRSYREVTA